MIRSNICLLLCLAVAHGYAAVMPGDDFNANTAAATTVLQQWHNRAGLWNTTGWWNAANCVDALEDAITVNDDDSYLPVLRRTFDLNSGGHFLNNYYDDEGWWALTWLRAFDLTGDTRYLKMAKTIFADMTGGWDAKCGGGIWWSKERTYKNAIANELFLLVAVRLHQRTPGDRGSSSYFDWALKEWAWFRDSGMVNSHNLVNDGLNQECQNNGKTTWSYNQGVILGGLVELYKATGDTQYLKLAVALADAAIATLIDTKGVLCEPRKVFGDNGDVPQFKGIFMRYLAGLYDVEPKPAYFKFLFENAHALWFNNRNRTNQFGMEWSGPVDKTDAARQSSALAPISALAEPMTTNLVFAKGAGAAAFNHGIGGVAGTLAWTCNATNATHADFMLFGPYCSSLPEGRHTAHFRLAVDATNSSTTKLVRLDARDNDNGIILATQAVAWNAFSEANQPQDFQLVFTNATPGDALEFRVFWNCAPDAPALTVTDVTIDGSRNWTAANLKHDLGRLDGLNGWEADPARDKTSGYLVNGPGTAEIPAGNCRARFELKVDNFNWDNSRVAELSVVEVETGSVIAARYLARSEFPNVRYQTFDVDFRAVAGRRYDFRTRWNYAVHAPRLTQRSLVVTTRQR